MMVCFRFLLVLTSVTTLFFMSDASFLNSETFLSSSIPLRPGSVSNKYYYGVGFPSGHIAVKEFSAELVYQNGTSLPLYETYLHHYTFTKIYQRKGSNLTAVSSYLIDSDNYTLANISGLCQYKSINFDFGVGSETRGMKYVFPDPYAIELGNPEEIPIDFEETWLLNLHVIDTRGVTDPVGCLECRCDLYNVTADTGGEPLPAGYKGGLNCCADEYQCKLRDGFQDAERMIYLKYTVKWVDWNSSILPVKIFLLDLTDSGERSSDLTVGCQVEHQIEACNHTVPGTECLSSNRTRLTMKTGGYLVYGVGHQHLGGLGSALYGQDGRTLCTSIPIYGNGTMAGNESGYLVAMSSCYPTPGSVKIMENEIVVLESNYSSEKLHTGVMSLFYILLADELPNSSG